MEELMMQMNPLQVYLLLPVILRMTIKMMTILSRATMTATMINMGTMMTTVVVIRILKIVMRNCQSLMMHLLLWQPNPMMMTTVMPPTCIGYQR